MQVDNVTLSTVGVGLGGGRPSVGANKGSIDVAEHISPHLANSYVKDLNLSDQKRSRRVKRTVRRGPQLGPLQRSIWEGSWSFLAAPLK